MNMTAMTSRASVMPADFSALTARLAAPRGEIERDFLRMGEKLIACTRLLNETSGAYGDMAGALAGPEFSSLAESLREVSQLVSGLDRDRIATQAFLKKLNELTLQFPDRIGALTRAVRTLQMFFVTARVVAATSGNKEANLTQFAAEFSKLGGQLEGNVSSFAHAFARMRDSLEAASGLNAEFGAQHAELLEGIAVEQRRNLEAMAQCRLWAESRVSAHDERSARINGRVGRAVSTLQVGDSTRQRVEHAEAALQKLIGLHDGAAASVVLALTSAQLRGAVEDFDSETGALATALEELVQDTQTLLDSAAEDSETLLSSGDSALGAIDRSLQQTTRMFEQYERSNAALTVAIDQLVASVGNMLDHVSAFDDIRQTVRLLSLNATIRSKTLNDDGRAFRQVATDLRALNDETNAPVEEVTVNLERSAAILREYLDARTSDQEIRAASLQATLDAARQGVGDIAHLLHERSAFMAETGPRALDQLREAAGTVTDRQDFCAVWRLIAGELTAFAGKPALQAFAAQDPGGLLAGLFGAYSMKAEREIHNLLLGIDAEEEDLPVGGGQDALGDIFF